MNKNAKAVKKTVISRSRMIVISGLLVGMSIVLGKFLAFNIGTSIRISFENLPILIAGILFGSAVGGAVGLCADLIGCIMAGYAINPVITLGAFSIGFLSGVISHSVLRKSHKLPAIACSVGVAHIIGSMLVKSIGMYLYYHTPFEVLSLRVPIYIVTGLLETYIIYLLLKNKSFSAQLERMCKNDI
ncbi:MAG: folate family ECF transporter S component [Ruminococcus sp.]|nr:folate family ECF transporter S component [Ruminococcus sp.]MDE7137228.1 folate family ECF transporter S component [Ruminococcus sp.]